jgi:hypothetical protein
MNAIAVIVGKEGWKLDRMPLKLWFLIIGFLFIILGVIPDGIMIALGVGLIIISVILYIKEKK